MVIATGGGCMTSKLWHDDAYVTPAPDARLQLFETPHGILAQFDTVSEHTGDVRRLSYYVEPNLSRVAAGKRPVTVAPGASEKRVPIPIFPAPVSVRSAPGIYAAFSTNDSAFTVYRGNYALGPCPLPVFEDPGRRRAKWVLTPLAVAGDATIEGGVIGVFTAYCYVAGRVPP